MKKHILTHLGRETLQLYHR